MSFITFFEAETPKYLIKTLLMLTDTEVFLKVMSWPIALQKL
jgi:hypothetical protein